MKPSRSKSSTDSRSSGRRNVLVFRRSEFSLGDDDDKRSYDLATPATPSGSLEPSDTQFGDHSESQPDSQFAAAAQSNDSVAAVVTSVADSQDQAPSPSLLSASINADVNSESDIFTDSQEMVSHVPDQEQCHHNAAPPSTSVEQRSDTVSLSITSPTQKSTPAVSHTPASPSVSRRSGGLTKGEIPTFFPLNTNPPSAQKRSATASRTVLSKSHKVAASESASTSAVEVKGKKSAAALLRSKKSAAASKKSNAAMLTPGKVDDRRLTFVTNKAGVDVKSLPAVDTALEELQSRSIVHSLEDGCDDDVELIMDENPDILLDVSGCSEPFDDNTDTSTLVPSFDGTSNVTVIAGRRSLAVSVPPSDAQQCATADGIPEENWVDDEVFSGAAEQAKDLPPAGDSTSLEVRDMELTNVNMSKSPQLIGSVSSDAGAPETAPNSTTVVKQPSQQNTKPTDSHRAAKKTTKESAKEKQSARRHSKSHKTTALSGPTVLSVSDKGMEISEGQDGTSLKTSAKSKCLPVKTVNSNGNAHRKSGSYTLKPSLGPKVALSSEVEEQAMEPLPKKVAAYVSKPGKIVYSTAQRRSSSAEPKSRSKSRSILPVQSRPKSKQLLLSASAPANSSPSSAFSFVGTPEQDMVCRPAAMLAARQKFISLDDSVVVSAPAEKPPVVRKRSLSATTNAQAGKVSDDEFSFSPHGIMLVVHGGKRTKPRLARSKTVRYRTSETLSTPPPVQQQKLSVPLTPYAKAADKPPSESADVDSVNMVPESPVFTSISTLQRRQQEVLVVDSTTQPAVDVTNDHSRKDDRASAEDNANAEKVFYSYCNFFVMPPSLS